MKKNIKKTLLAFSLVAFGTACAGGFAFNSAEANAAEPAKFAMIDGASVRLTKEYETFGIRFKATVVDETKSYNMLILPSELVTAYELDTTENKAEIVPYMIDKFTEEKLSIIENIVPNDGVISGSIVNILWENINRSFVGYAYYMDGTDYVIAESAADGKRSVVDVSKNAIASTDYDVKEGDSDKVKAEKIANKNALVEKVRFGQKQKKGFAKTDVYVYEDFAYAADDFASGMNMKVSLNDNNGSEASLIENGEDNAVQFTRAADKYNMLVLNFDTQPAGNYKLSFKMQDNDVANYGYNNWKLMGGAGFAEDYGYLYAKHYVGNDTFEYYFTTDAEGYILFGIAGLNADKTFSGIGQM
ncbi:MAG: hypothetical protein IJB97_07610, partial [Clostridia bacterium]|nr:hypothetical protein [Clostridia bacterium]